jgi:hypothetical protein
MVRAVGTLDLQADARKHGDVVLVEKNSHTSDTKLSHNVADWHAVDAARAT